MIRTCIGCRAARPAHELVRFALRDGDVVEGRAAPGRGAWLCRGNEQCRSAALRTRAFSRAFRRPVVVAEGGPLASRRPDDDGALMS